MVERAIILSDGDKLTVNEFAFAGLKDIEVDEVDINVEETFDLDEIERLTIIRALERADNKKVEAAQLLNITRQSLDRRLEKYGIILD
ncbi:MAG: helix-turn-helix domain-containing protein [Bacteroidales bacterium]|nr:helix-turn-helix domain-containing protein [Bacteroidales bacterium]